MLKIAICDDDAGDRERIAEDLRVYAAAHQEHSIEMTVYSSAFAMLDAFEKAGCPDIALLDICMPGMLGTELARDILRCSENTDILFLTTSSDYAVDAFALHAADYIQKPYTQEKLNASLDRVIALRQERTWLLLPCEGEPHRAGGRAVHRDRRQAAQLLSGLRPEADGAADRRPAAGLSGGTARHDPVRGLLRCEPCAGPLLFRHGPYHGRRRAHSRSAAAARPN